MTDAERIEQLENDLTRALSLINQAAPDKLNFPFIAGHGDTKDHNGMPDTILVCPAYGSDILYVYKKEKPHDIRRKVQESNSRL